MSQNIFLLIRSDIKALDAKVDSLQAAIEDVRANLPDVSELSAQLEAQSATLDTIVTQVNNINDILNPEIPPPDEDVPVVQSRKAKK